VRWWVGPLFFLVRPGRIMKSFGERSAIVMTPGCLALTVFEEGDVSFTLSGAVQVSRVESGELVLSATGAPLSVIRDRAEMFTCAAAADFTITVSP